MARLFDDAATEYLELDSAPLTAYPFTMSCRFYSDDITANQTLCFIGDKDSETDFWRLAVLGAVGGDPIALQSNDGTTERADTSTGFSVNTWHHACGVAVSATDRSCFIDGGSEGTSTTSITPAGSDRISVGRGGKLTPNFYMSGRIAELGVWNVALSDAEVATLAKGFSPLFIQPHNLVAYWPLIRDDDNDWIGGFDLTATNTPTIAVHPPLVVHPAWQG